MIYLVRYCQVAGQSTEAALTADGKRQASELVKFLRSKGIIHIVTSPYIWAVQSIEQTAKSLELHIKTDARLVERVLTPGYLPDWLKHLERSFIDLALKLPLEESRREGSKFEKAAPSHSILMTHGNLLHW